MQDIGIDFGTTNTVAAFTQSDGSVRSASFRTGEVFRSVLCFWLEQEKASQHLRHAAGPDGVAAYLDDPLESRLILSMKTYLSQRSFSETRIFGRRFTLQTLIATFLRGLAEACGFNPAEVRATIGRPVRFAGEFPDDAFGEQRLREAFSEAGFSDCQSASKRDPGSAYKKDPSFTAVVACPGSEQEGPARPRSAFQQRWRSGRVGGACLPTWASWARTLERRRGVQTRFLKRQLSLPVSMMSQ